MASFFEESLFFGMAVSLIAYGLGLLLKKKLKWAFLNPLLKLLKENLLAVVLGIVSGVIASMGGIFVLALAFGLNHEQYVTLLPKSITTAIGMGVSEELHGITTITVAVIIVTGVLGNVIADPGAHRQRPGPWNLRPCHRHFQSPGTRRGGRSHEQPFDCGGRYSDCGRSVGLRESDSVRIS